MPTVSIRCFAELSSNLFLVELVKQTLWKNGCIPVPDSTEADSTLFVAPSPNIGLGVAVYEEVVSGKPVFVLLERSSCDKHFAAFAREHPSLTVITYWKRNFPQQVGEHLARWASELPTREREEEPASDG